MKNSTPQLRGPQKPLLLLRLATIGDLFGDQGGVAAGSVVDDEINLDLVPYGLVHDLCRVLAHLLIQDPRSPFVE
jgi:hypothetical protein